MSLKLRTGNSSSTKDLGAPANPTTESLDMMREINELKEEIQKLAKEKDKYKQRVADLEKEKAKQSEEFGIKLKTETHMQALSNNRIEDLNKNVFNLTKKVIRYEEGQRS